MTDKLRSYGWAFRQLQLICPHEQGAPEEPIAPRIPITCTATAQDAAVQIGSPRVWDLAICEIRHTLGCMINLCTFLAWLSLMIAGLRGIVRGDDGAVAWDLDWRGA